MNEESHKGTDLIGCRSDESDTNRDHKEVGAVCTKRVD
jgi:hypothetical protein